MGFPGGSAGKESTCNAEDLRSILGSGRSLGEGNSYPLLYSGLKNSVDCRVQRVTKSRTKLSDFFFFFFLRTQSVTGSVYVLSHVQLFATLWTLAGQAPLSMRFSRQEYWSG